MTDFLMSPYGVCEQQEGRVKIKSGSYFGVVNCDNCQQQVILDILKGIPHPKTFPDIICPFCDVQGTLYKPPTELDLMKSLGLF